MAKVRLDDFRLGTVEDGPKGKHCGLAEPPLRVFDVLVDEGEDDGQHAVLDVGGKEGQASARRQRDVGGDVLLVLVLLQQALEKKGDEGGQHATNEVEALYGGVGLGVTVLDIIQELHDADLLLAHCVPELNGLHRHNVVLARVRLDGFEGHIEYFLDVAVQLDVVQGGHAHQALHCFGLDLGRGATLGGGDDGRHDDIALVLGIEVALGQLQHVVQRHGGG
mmetsp:Transcript_42713/g.107819  ORF Transcript_42713/g.107819 Transcript_42713/m.107819 type:complete len:222 (+) Transcript_42713:1687-2352(+)